MFRRLFSLFLTALFIVFGLVTPVEASILRLPQNRDGTPDWTKISFDNMGTVQDSNTGILDDTGLMQQLGYNPSRSYSEGDSISSIIKVGDLDVLTRNKSTVRDFLGGVDPKNISLGEFPAVNGASINDLVSTVPGFGQLAVQSVPFIQGIISGSPSQITSGGLAIAQTLSPEVNGFLKANPWAANLPIEQLMQGNWNGVLAKGVEIGLPKLVEAVPSLAQVPIGDLFGSAMSGDYKGLITTGVNTAISKFGGNIPGLANIPVGDILGGVMGGDYRGLLQIGINMGVAEFAKQFPAIANAPIGALANINNFSLASIPNLASIALATPWIKNQIIKNVPGLANVPLDSLLSIFKAATAVVDVPDQGASIAPRAMTGGGSSFMSVPCAGPACSNFEVNQAKALIPADRLNGLQMVVGSRKQDKGQSTKGGIGILGKMFGGKEPVHIRPWGDDANIAMAVLNVDDAKGSAQLGFFLRVCVKPPFMPRTCTPYAIGPIPFKSVHEGDVVVIQSTSPPPISNPDMGGGYSDCGSPSTASNSGSGSSGSASNASSPPSGSNLKKYLDMISFGESTNNTNIGVMNGRGPYGEYQFIPTTRADILRKYGYDAWSQSKPERDQAAIALIKDVGGRRTLDAINSGNFNAAHQVLNGTWTSLPGGAESNWTPETLARYGSGNGSGNSGTLVASATGGASCGGVECPKTGPCYLHHPLPNGIITSGYGPRNGRIHHGVDIQSRNGYAGSGDPVLAAADGQILATPDYFGGIRNYGYRIEAGHVERGLVTTYNHLASRNVQPGAKIRRGQQIGKEGNTSGGMPIHLHFETQRGQGLVNGDFDPTTMQYQPTLR